MGDIRARSNGVGMLRTMSTHRPRAAAFALVALVGVMPTGALASDIDFFEGTVAGSSRVIGLGGAYGAIAEGVDGGFANPASVGIRPPHVADSWFDWDAGISWAQSAGGAQRLELSDAEPFDGRSIGLGGLHLRFGRLGLGANVLWQRYELPGQQGAVTYNQALVAPTAAWAFGQGGLVVGVSWPVGGTWFGNVRDKRTLSVDGIPRGPQLGVLWAPRYERQRFGLSFRLPSEQRGTLGEDEEASDGSVTAAAPSRLQVPWEARAAFSYQFGPRHYNRRNTFGTARWGRERRRDIPRAYTLASADLVVSGPASAAVGTAGFLQGQPQRSGRLPTVALHAGVEAEVVPWWLVLRAGAYAEPSRFEALSWRPHVTGGLDVRLPLVLEWKLTAAVDAAPDYLNVVLGVGLWN